MDLFIEIDLGFDELRWDFFEWLDHGFSQYPDNVQIHFCLVPEADQYFEIYAPFSS